MSTYIDTEERSAHYRTKGIDLHARQILITEFACSKQSQDITLSHNCHGVGRIHHFRRDATVLNFMPNPLPIDPASRALSLPPQKMMQAQVFQNAVCSWRCWYCFVDYNLLDGNLKRSTFLSADDLVDLYLDEPVQCPIIDLSGGQPDLVPEWVLWMMDALLIRGLEQKTYLWSDDNLSNEYLWQCLTDEELRRIVSYPTYGRVGCFKGFSTESFSFNTKAAPDLFAKQFKIMRRLVNTGLDMYGYVTLTSRNTQNIESKIAEFITRLQEEVHPLFPLRTVPLPILEFTPTRSRMDEEHYRAVSFQEEAVAVWNSLIEKRFSTQLRMAPIYSHDLGIRTNFS